MNQFKGCFSAKNENIDFSGLAITMHSRTWYESLDWGKTVIGADFDKQYQPPMDMVIVTASDGKNYEGKLFSKLPAGKYNIKIQGNDYTTFPHINDLNIEYDVTVNANQKTADPRFIGEWELYKGVDANGTEYNGGRYPITATLNDDFTGTVSVSGRQYPLEWSSNGDTADVKTLDDGAVYHGILTNEGYGYATIQSGYTGYFRKAESEYILGDANNDGLVDGRDATMVLTEYARTSANGGTPFSGDGRTVKAADIDENGIIDARDATSILTYYAYISVDGNPQTDLRTWYNSKNR